MGQAVATEPNEIELVYSYLLNAFRQAHSKGDTDTGNKVLIAVEVMETLWPDDTKRWSDRFDAKTVR